MHAFVLDTNKQPLAPCHAAVARKLLKQGKAAIFRRFPFTIIFKETKKLGEDTLRLKIDPGSKHTGIAILSGVRVVWAAELEHRGYYIKKALDQRSAIRRGRRNRKTRYRVCRILNRARPKDWLPPSIKSRVDNTITWVNRLCRLSPIANLSMELVKFDMQLMQKPEISGIEYQQGELQGYEVREYLLEKFGRQCAYCEDKDLPLQIEHVVPRNPKYGVKGTNRVSNLTLACDGCNKVKGNLQPTVWLEKLQVSKKPKDVLRAKNLPGVLKKIKQPLKDAAAVNSTRWALFHQLEETGLPVETGSGGLTKFNRTKQSLPKTHWLDAVCVGKSTPESIIVQVTNVLHITAKGHGNRQQSLVDKYGFPIAKIPRKKTFQGFQTGDLVKALIPVGKYAGRYVGRIAIRHRPCFRLLGFDVHPKYLSILQRSDGYGYRYDSLGIPIPPMADARGAHLGTQ